MAYSMGDLKKGLKIELEGIPYRVVEYQHVKPGKGAAFVRAKIKSLIDGRVLEKTFHAGDKADEPNLEQRVMNFSYADDDYMHFIEQESYEMYPLTHDQVGDAKDYIIDSTEVEVLFHNGKPITVDVPAIVELLVVETPPNFKGDTTSGSRKPAKLETGLTVQVPYHVLEGDKVKVDSKTGDYLEKVK
jgi:elongation factor P